MQFTSIFALAIFATSAMAGTIKARQDEPFPKGDNNCYEGTNCCYPSEQACKNQIGSFNAYFSQYCSLTSTENNPSSTNARFAFCQNLKVDTTGCTADCCRIDTGTGRNCPAKIIYD